MLSRPFAPNIAQYRWLALAGSLLLLFVQLLLPLNGDAELYQSMAGEFHRYSWLPYVNSWDQNFPGVVVLHWLSILCFGDSWLGFRTFDILLHLAASWALYELLRRWLTPSLAALSVILYNVQYLVGVNNTAGERDEFAAALLIIATFLIFDHRRSLTTLFDFAAGSLFGLIALIRMTYAPFIVIGVWYLWSTRRQISISFAAGVILVFLIVLTPYVLIDGALHRAYLATIRFNSELYGTDRNSVGLLFRILANYKFFLAPALIGVCACFLPNNTRSSNLNALFKRLTVLPRSERVLFGAYFIVAMTSVLVMGKYYVYHFAILLLLPLPFAAIGFGTLFSLINGRGFRFLLVLCIVTFACLRVMPLFLFAPFVEEVRNGSSDPVHASWSRSDDPELTPNDCDTVAAYIEQHTSSEDRFESISSVASLRWRIHRKSATAFTTLFPLVVRNAVGLRPDFQEQYRREYVDSLLSAKPRYLVFSETPMWGLGSSHKLAHAIAGFDSLVWPQYRLDTVIGLFTLYRRK